LCPLFAFFLWSSIYHVKLTKSFFPFPRGASPAQLGKCLPPGPGSNPSFLLPFPAKDGVNARGGFKKTPFSPVFLYSKPYFIDFPYFGPKMGLVFDKKKIISIIICNDKDAFVLSIV
jgi:hypothetical protein